MVLSTWEQYDGVNECQQKLIQTLFPVTVLLSSRPYPCEAGGRCLAGVVSAASYHRSIVIVLRPTGILVASHLCRSHLRLHIHHGVVGSRQFNRHPVCLPNAVWPRRRAGAPEGRRGQFIARQRNHTWCQIESNRRCVYATIKQNHCGDNRKIVSQCLCIYYH